MKKLVGAVALLFCISLVPAKADDNAVYTFIQALQDAAKEAGGGQLIKGRVEGKGLFGFYFLINGRLIEIEVRNPGKIVKEKDVQEIPQSGPVNPKVVDLLRVRAKTKLPVSRYIEIAMEQGKGGDITTFNLVPNGDRLYVEVGVEGGSKVTMDENGKVQN